MEARALPILNVVTRTLLKPTDVWLRKVDLVLRIRAEDDIVAANTLMQPAKQVQVQNGASEDLSAGELHRALEASK
jgi:hypothetical protein